MLQLRKQRSCAQNISHAGNRICVPHHLWDAPPFDAALLVVALKLKSHLLKRGKTGDILCFSFSQQTP